MVASTFVGNALGAGAASLTRVDDQNVSQLRWCYNKLKSRCAACLTDRHPSWFLSDALFVDFALAGDALQAKTSALAAILTAPIIWVLVATALVEPHAQRALMLLFTDGKDPVLLVRTRWVMGGSLLRGVTNARLTGQVSAWVSCFKGFQQLTAVSMLTMYAGPPAQAAAHCCCTRAV
jgi:hypothetical protein